MKCTRFKGQEVFLVPMPDALTERPLISICIPAYKRPENVVRLLQSISIQTFRDFEIVLSDDSPDETVREVVTRFPGLPLSYHHNAKALGTPANWNFGIGLARGEWIKIMHDDDWFRRKDSLERFADAAKKGVKFIVSRYQNVYESGIIEKPGFPADWKGKIVKNPLLLLARNVIGPPSVTMVHRSIKEEYDVRMKWRVDIDFYVRVLSQLQSFYLIDEPLVNVGISSSQVTHNCINMPEVELPEGLLMLQKFGVAPLRNILVYDAWWRILRNVKVRRVQDLSKYTQGETWPPLLYRMARQQSRIPVSFLSTGALSKFTMLISYLSNKAYLNDK
jgi:glycosyltransferase involved in cell wall biosynthesis